MIDLLLQRSSSLISPHPLSQHTRSCPIRHSNLCVYSSLTSILHYSAENQWLHLKLIADLKKSCREVFPVVEYAYTTIPTYPSGQIGFMVCCKDATRDVKSPLRVTSDEEEEKLYRYYNKRIHEASFVLPTFAALALK